MIRYDPEQDAYAVLGVQPDAAQEDIDEAFRRAALMWHPDKTSAPDAAERFHEVRVAARVLRDRRKRAEYDRMRALFLGPAARPRRAKPRASKPPEPFVPMRPPPDWLADKVRVYHDCVHLPLEAPGRHPRAAAVLNGLALVTLGASVTAGRLLYFGLAVVLWAMGRVLRQPPHGGVLTWAKIVPGRRVAELHTLDQRLARYRCRDVPFDLLRVVVLQGAGGYRLEVRGLPRVRAPVLWRTRDPGDAERRAKEAGAWLQIPHAKHAA